MVRQFLFDQGILSIVCHLLRFACLGKKICDTLIFLAGHALGPQVEAVFRIVPKIPGGFKRNLSRIMARGNVEAKGDRPASTFAITGIGGLDDVLQRAREAPQAAYRCGRYV